MDRLLRQVSRHERAMVVLGLLLVEGAAWAYLWSGAGTLEDMGGMLMPMSSGPWTPAHALVMLAMWWVMMVAMNPTVDLQSMDEAQMRQMLQALLSRVQQQDAVVQQQAAELRHKQALLDKLTFENAMLKRLKFAAKSEALNADQRSLLDEALDADLAALAEEIGQMQAGADRQTRQQPNSR